MKEYNNQYDNQLTIASEIMKDEYLSDKELTIFTHLNSEDYFEDYFEEE